MLARYPFLTKTTFQILIAAIRGKKRSIYKDSADLVSRLNPPLQIQGKGYIPGHGPCLVTVNHYTRPGFPSWWISLAVSAAIPADICWIMTAAWTFPANPLKHHLLTPLTRQVFTRLALVYGFITMPAMPPDPRETAARAQSVRAVLITARQAPQAWIGLAPEGGDSRNGELGSLPPGAGRFMIHLARLGYPILPAGVFEAGGILHVRFGPPYQISIPQGMPGAGRDEQAGEIVMRSIARLLPPHLQGKFRPSLG